MVEYVDIVNNNGTVIGKTTRNNAHIKGLLHPTVKILLFNSSGKILIQQRSRKKNILPLYWDISVAEHLRSGESYKEAAVRGLMEELAIVTRVKLLRGKHVQRSEHKKDKLLKEYELTVLYGTLYNGKIIPDSEEVEKSIFVSIRKFGGLILWRRLQFTPWALNEINYLLAHKDIMEKLNKKWPVANQQKKKFISKSS